MYVAPDKRDINKVQKSQKRYLVIYFNLHGEKVKQRKLVLPECAGKVISHERKKYGLIPPVWLCSILIPNGVRLLTLTQF